MTVRAAVELELAVPNWAKPSTRGILDYGLAGQAGAILAVVKAKRSSRNVREGEEQLRNYLRNLAGQQSEVPYGFLANGQEIWFLEAPEANPRLVAGFFTRGDLERVQHLRLIGICLSDRNLLFRGGVGLGIGIGEGGETEG